MPDYPFPRVLDSSILADYKSCAQKGFRLHIQEWKPKGTRIDLHAGGAFARGLEVARRLHYIEGVAPDEAVAGGLEALLKFYGNAECPADNPKSAERMAGALEYYFAQYPLDETNPPITLPSGDRGIEFGFVHPLPLAHPESGEPLLYSGRMDAVLHYAGGIFICDEKTTRQLGATWGRQWDLRSQFTGYKWGCAQSGVRVDGVIVRGVSILKTKYETVEAISYRPDWQVERWFTETMDLIEEMISNWRRGKHRHNLDHACSEYGGCAFRQVCGTKPDEQQPWLETYFERRHWDPVTRDETLL